MGFGDSAEVSGVQSLVPPEKYIGDGFSESTAKHSLSAELFSICGPEGGRAFLGQVFFCLVI